MRRSGLVLMALFFIANVVLSCPAWAEDAPPSVETAAGTKREIFLCCEEREWYPFVYTQGEEVMGMHMDIVKEAVRRAGFTLKIKAYPLKRCLKMAEHKEVDGMISITYDKNYAQYFEFPPDTPNLKESEWGIMQLDDVVITSAENGYEFTGDIRTLPVPVRTVRNDPIVPYLTQAGLAVEVSNTDRQNLVKLIRDRTGSVITSSLGAETVYQDEVFRDKINIASVPLRSQSYFLAFSWGSSLSPEDRKKIWGYLAELRRDYIFMMRIFSQY